MEFEPLASALPLECLELLAGEVHPQLERRHMGNADGQARAPLAVFGSVSGGRGPGWSPRSRPGTG